MKRKILSVLLALVLVLSFSLVTTVPVAAADPTTIESSTMIFQSVPGYTLTDEGGGIYSGMIPMVQNEGAPPGDGVAGYDLFARNGATAWFGDGVDPVWTPVVIADHDAWPTWDVDTPDWDGYSLRFYEENGDQKWRVANHSGTGGTAWYELDGKEVEQGVPMSGTMDWVAMYAAETDVGEYLPPIDPLTHPEIPGGAATQDGGPACWDMDWSWGSEVIPLAFPGFDVVITDTGDGSFQVTMTPAAAVGILPLGPVVNENTGESYGTIQAAIDDASINDTIKVAAGTYAEALFIDDSLTLLGAKDGQDARTRDTASGESIVDGSGLDLDAGVGAFNIADGVSNVMIDGFEICNWPASSNPGNGSAVMAYSYGGATQGLSQITIQNNYMHDLGWNGILVWSNNNVVQDYFMIQFNLIEEAPYAGIELTNVTNSQVLNNKVIAPTVLAPDLGDAGVGIEIAVRAQPGIAISAGNVLVEGNEISGAFPEGSRAGINILSRTYASDSNATLTGVTVKGNTVSANVIVGILAVAESRDNGPATISNLQIVDDNIVSGFSKTGIVAKDVDSVQIEGNTVSTTEHGLATNGIQIGYLLEGEPVSTGTTGTIIGNQVSDFHYGLYNPAEQTYEEEWTASGILVIDTESALEISGNEVQSCDVAMDIEAGSGTLITSNNVHDNSYGFVLWNANPAINFNNIYQNGLGGVYRTYSLEGILDATNNWWGDATGPYHETANLSGTGNKVSDNVNFDLWLPQLYPTPPTVVIDATTSIGFTLATLNATLDDLGSALSIEVSFEWGTTIDYDIGAEVTQLSEAGVFSATISGLSPSTTYIFKVVAEGHGTSYSTGTFTTATVPPTPAAPPAPPEGTTDVRGDVDPAGVFLEPVTAISEDELCTLTIPEGTVGLTEELEPIDEITMVIMDEPPPPPEDAHVIGLTYDFGPDKATFEPPITLTFSYDPSALPEGVAEEDLVLAYYDEDTGEWVEIAGVVDTENNTITALIAHFTTFAIIGRVPAPAPLPAAFTVSSLGVSPSELAPGEEVNISVLVANTGGESGSYTVVLKINGVKEAEETVTVAAGSSQTVSFSVTKEAAGIYSVAVAQLSGSFTVVAPPAVFSVSSLSIQPAEVEAATAVTVAVTVANTGGESGSYTVVLKVNGVKEAERTVTIAAGDSQEVSFSLTRDEPGTYTVSVDGLSGSFTVVAPPPGINWPVIGGVIAGVIIAGLLIYFLVVRRRAY